MVRATLESLAYQTADVLAAMEADAGVKLSSLRVDGGASANDFLMQFQSDIAGVPVERPACIETTAFGAAAFAGLATGFWSSRDEVAAVREVAKTFVPEKDDQWRAGSLSGWHQAVARVRGKF